MAAQLQTERGQEPWDDHFSDEKGNDFDSEVQQLDYGKEWINAGP